MDISLTITLDDAPNPDDVEAVSHNLLNFNRQHAPEDHYRLSGASAPPGRR